MLPRGPIATGPSHQLTCCPSMGGRGGPELPQNPRARCARIEVVEPLVGRTESQSCRSPAGVVAQCGAGIDDASGLQPPPQPAVRCDGVEVGVSRTDVEGPVAADDRCKRRRGRCETPTGGLRDNARRSDWRRCSVRRGASRARTPAGAGSGASARVRQPTVSRAWRRLLRSILPTAVSGITSTMCNSRGYL
jgi:hypothetical protein